MSQAQSNVFRMEPVKKTVNERLKERLAERDELLGTLLHNDSVSQKKIKELEQAHQAHHKETIALMLFHGASFFGRLRWLILGR